MSSDDCPVGMRHLQFSGKALRPDGLLGVILPSFILLMEKLANVLLGVFGDTREGGTLRIRGVRGRRSVIAVQGIKKLKIRVKQEYGDRKRKKGTYSQRRRIAGGSLEGPSPERLLLAIAIEKLGFFG